MDSRQAQQELQTFQQNRKSAGDYYSQYQNELGVGSAQQRANDMRQLIRNTETALKGVDESVSGRTQGSLVSEPQRQRLANMERQPLAEQLGGLQGGYSDEMQNYRDLLGQAGTKANLAYQSDADRLNALEGNYNRLFAQESAAEERRRWETELAEQRRQADSSASAKAASSFTPTFGNVGGQSTSPAQDPLKQRAQGAVLDLLGTNNTNLIKKTYDAIKKSAGYGNTYDQLKLQLIEQLYPAARSFGKNTVKLGPYNPTVVARL
jgi:hypothetical protein